MGKLFIDGKSYKVADGIPFLELDDFIEEDSGYWPKHPDSNESFEFECNLGQINMELLESLAYPDGTLPTSITLEAKTPEWVQRRRHKKKRINKKWAKRYGYIQVFKTIKFKDVSIIPNEEGFDFVGGSMDD